MKKKIILTTFLLITIILCYLIFLKHNEWKTLLDCHEFPKSCYQDIHKIVKKESVHLTDLELERRLSKEPFLNNFESIHVTRKNNYLLINIELNESFFSEWESEKDHISLINYDNITKASFWDFFFINQTAFTVYY